MTTSLVTGGAGFLGSDLCDRLLGRGDRVIRIDNIGARESEQYRAYPPEIFEYRNIDIDELDYVDEPVDLVRIGPSSIMNEIQCADGDRPAEGQACPER
jgi:dTDP-glucose 4,6-dehydratase